MMTRGSGNRAGVAAGHEKVCEAAHDVLRAGGNAFDAVVAAGLAATVAEPALTSLGGGGFLLARSSDGRASVYDFFSDTPGRELPPRELEPHFLPITVRFPGSDQIFNVGLGSCAVPGNLRGFLHVHARLGRLPLTEIIAPAIELARGGVRLNYHQAYFLDLLRPIVTLHEEGRAIFAADGDLATEGDPIRNPDLADFLECLPREGERDFYEGALAERISADMHEGQGLLTRADLAAYRVIEREPLEVAYRGWRLLTNPPPSFGGALLALSLELLAETPAAVGGYEGVQHARSLLGVMQEVDRQRAEGNSSTEALAALSDAERRVIFERVRRFSGGTTHVSICDTEGNAASMTTSNGEGSGYFVPGTGIHLNNMLGEDDLHPDGFHAAPPGVRVSSMMSPSLLLEGEALRLVLGSGGSKRIRTTLLQLTSALVDFDLPPKQAIEHPRMHWDGEMLQMEPGFPAETERALATVAPINVWDRLDVYFGGAHVVAPDGRGAGDPRRGGAMSPA